MTNRIIYGHQGREGNTSKKSVRREMMRVNEEEIERDIRDYLDSVPNPFYTANNQALLRDHSLKDYRSE